jgi:hypothetical protein
LFSLALALSVFVAETGGCACVAAKGYTHGFEKRLRFEIADFVCLAMSFSLRKIAVDVRSLR